MRLTFIAAFAVAVSGCSSFQTSGPTIVGMDGAACVGTLPQTLPGLAPATSAKAVGATLGATDLGGLCAGRAFVSVQPMVVYRLWDSGKNNRFSEWWAMEAPSGARDQYRDQYAICPNWNQLDRMLQCVLPPKTEVIVGNTQSLKCDDGSSFAKSSTLQLYIASARRDDANWQCTEAPWPK